MGRVIDTAPDFLMHHGILGMKWGVRRFQNKDGTRTEAGKLRYRGSLEKDFSNAERSVRSRMSNHYSAYKKQPMDLDAVRRRGSLTVKEAELCSLAANRIFDQAAEREPRITKTVVDVVRDSGASMFGLEFRLKQPTSIAAKIGQDAKEKDISFPDAAAKLNDVLRYTAVAEDNSFTRTYNSVKARLLKLGYSEVKCKNYFDSYSKGLVKHKSVQSVFQDISGTRFELQFQTPASQAAKELKLPLYEERRVSSITPARAAQLELQMQDLAERIKNPKDVFSIRSHG